MINRILVLCRALPDPTKSSGELRFWHILQHLRACCAQVEVFSETAGNAELHDLPVYPMEELPGRSPGADVALLEFWFMDVHLPALRAAGVPVIIDSVDVEFLRRARERALHGLPDGDYRVEEARERAAYHQADQIWMVSDLDAAELPDEQHKMVVVPNIFVPPGTVPGFDARHGVVFVGSYHHQPNVDGLRWYRDAVMPLLPELPHCFVGHGAPADLATLPGFVGGVSDSTALVQQARVSIAPLRYGAGLKGKVLEAMACGTPVVTTAIGDEGYSAGAGGAAIVAASPAEFADAVRRLHGDRAHWETCAARGRAMAHAFVPEVVGVRIDAALNHVVATGVAR